MAKDIPKQQKTVIVNNNPTVTTTRYVEMVLVDNRLVPEQNEEKPAAKLN